MTYWLTVEKKEVEQVIRQIDSYDLPRHKRFDGRALAIRLSDSPTFATGVQGSFGAVFIRQLLSALGFDEHRQLRWRLEHKLQQALVFDHYLPGMVPRTAGASQCALTDAVNPLREIFARYFPNGFFIKRALSDSSGDRGVSDATERLLSSGDRAQLEVSASARVLDELWVVQEKIDIRKEYRVHTFEDRVVTDLCFARYAKGNIPGERDAPNTFVQGLLDRLPSALVGESLLGWDVASVDDRGFVVIEVNFSGFHLIYRRGFQCSGYFQDRDWGANSVARLLRFIEAHSNVRIELLPDLEEDSKGRNFYRDVNAWREHPAIQPSPGADVRFDVESSLQKIPQGTRSNLVPSGKKA
jgi:hypothetical protein